MQQIHFISRHKPGVGGGAEYLSSESHKGFRTRTQDRVACCILSPESGLTQLIRRSVNDRHSLLYPHAHIRRLMRGTRIIKAGNTQGALAT